MLRTISSLRVAARATRAFATATRVEADLLGDLEVPKDAYYGVQTQRALNNYDITGVRLNHFPNFIKAFAMVKKACAMANNRLGIMDDDVSNAICQACDECTEGKLDDQFQVDMIQGGAGTSTNMNANEVVANRAIEILGGELGDYSIVSPNDHVNKCQSTNDAYPSSAKLAIMLEHTKLAGELTKLIDSLGAKGEEFKDVVKMGRTQLQDAVPMTLGQEFDGYARSLRSDLSIVLEAVNRFNIVNLGGTAIGTGTAAHPEFSAEAVKALQEVTGIPIVLADNLVAASSSTGTMLYFHGVLKRLAVKTSQMCNDLRLLASGPRCGLHEINLPARAPGSSIMPGKVNPVIPEVVNQTCFQVIGNDIAVTMASEAGQLELNVMEPVIIYNLFHSMEMMTKAFKTLRTLCVDDITANVEHCREQVTNSIGIVTCLLPYIGYKNASMAAKTALNENKAVGDVLVEKKLLTQEEVDELLVPEKMLAPSYITK